MAKTSCLVCGTPCVWCAKRCHCWLKESQVRTLNAIISEDRDILNHKDKLDGVLSLLKSWVPSPVITEAVKTEWGIMENKIKEIKDKLKNEEEAAKEEAAKQYGTCVYPLWSSRLWQWAECKYCGQTKFYNKGQKCPALNTKE